MFLKDITCLCEHHPYFLLNPFQFCILRYYVPCHLGFLVSNLPQIVESSSVALNSSNYIIPFLSVFFIFKVAPQGLLYTTSRALLTW